MNVGKVVEREREELVGRLQPVRAVAREPSMIQASYQPSQLQWTEAVHHFEPQEKRWQPLVRPHHRRELS
jgi:hypothetical protein